MTEHIAGEIIDVVSDRVDSGIHTRITVDLRVRIAPQDLQRVDITKPISIQQEPK
ncbi:hypothetical protein FOB82_03060 [Corynebacterium xerosis]|uniref:Uncharacterized protein n=1 Tax=Corynebacterium xerosis TaxID=1725 RepID=A0A6B8TM80_9CORY|nr:hypothetical protein [Corynebacterium xerosis]QGS34076.1 hypothetical protein FOB82_03060 [Corynebacterium xerosis]